MDLIKPFKGICYNTKKVSLEKVTAPPYDIIDQKDQNTFYEKDEHNVIRLILGKINETDTDENNRYTRAGDYLDKWIGEDTLSEDKEAFYYILKQDYKIGGVSRSSYGVIAAIRVHPWTDKIILPHEKTLSKPKADRLNLFKATSANLSPVYMLYEDDNKTADRFLSLYSETHEASGSFTDTAGVVNTFWKMSEADGRVFADYINKRNLFIADGHHRYETALNYKEYRKSLDENNNEEKPYNFVMTYLTGAIEDRLTIFPTHRMIFNFGKDKIKNSFTEIKKYFDVTDVFSLDEMKTKLKNNFSKHAYGFYMKGETFKVMTLKECVSLKEAMPNEKTEATRELDVRILHSLVFENILSATPEMQADASVIRYTRDDNEACERVDSGEFEAAVFLNPTPLSSIIKVSLAGDVMPQKSTFFFPKLPSGIVMRKM